jgi:hypothetical protein
MGGSWEDQVNEGYGEHVSETYGSGMGGNTPSDSSHDSGTGWNWGRTWDDVAAAAAGLLAGVLSGNIAAGVAIAALVKKGLNNDLAREIVTQVQNGSIPPSEASETVASQLPPPDGDYAPTDPTQSLPDDGDPTHPDYWDEYTDRFFGTDKTPSYEDMVLNNAEFMRNRAEDLKRTVSQINQERQAAAQSAVGSYDAQIEGLLGQANAQSGIYNPVGFSFGGTEHSWTPRQGLNLGSHISGLAGDQLSSQLGLGEYIGSNAEREALMNFGLAGILSPEAGNLDYMNTLQMLGLKEEGLKQGIDIAKIQNGQNKATDLQAWAEAIDTGNSAIDLWNQVFNDKES